MRAFSRFGRQDFEFIRNLGSMYYGGSHLGEMIVTSERITPGDSESWFTEWDKLWHILLSRADASLSAGHRESARAVYLHASTYSLARFGTGLAVKEPRTFDDLTTRANPLNSNAP